MSFPLNYLSPIAEKITDQFQSKTGQALWSAGESMVGMATAGIGAKLIHRALQGGLSSSASSQATQVAKKLISVGAGLAGSILTHRGLSRLSGIALLRTATPVNCSSQNDFTDQFLGALSLALPTMDPSFGFARLLPGIGTSPRCEGAQLGSLVAEIGLTVLVGAGAKALTRGIRQRPRAHHQVIREFKRIPVPEHLKIIHRR